MAGYLIAQVGAETIRRGPVASRAEGRRRWPFLPADAAWEGEDEGEVTRAVVCSASLPGHVVQHPPPLTYGQRTWRDRVRRQRRAERYRAHWAAKLDARAEGGRAG